MCNYWFNCRDNTSYKTKFIIMKDKVFPLTNLVLYAKGWYLKTDDIWDDLKKILALDDYTPFTNNDVYSIIVNRFSKFECRQSELPQVLFGIIPTECWKVGYDYTVDKPYDTKTAVIYYILSALRDLDKDKWIPKTPKYTKYPQNKNITINKVYNHFCKI